MKPLTRPSALDPVVCFGTVLHERMTEARNRFVYPLAYLRLPLSRWSQIRAPLLGLDCAGVFGVYSGDHGARDGSPLLPWVRALLAEHRLDAVCDGEVVLQAFPRMFGYVFNPVSFWFCHDRDSRLRVVLAEVNNTFGERHNYLVHHADLRPIISGDELHARKVFHVSPFFPVSGEYRFRFGLDGAAHAVQIDYWNEGVCQLRTCIAGHAEMLDGKALRRWLLRFPFMTLGVMVRIHWQALRLWRRRVSFFRKPLPPMKETT